MPNTDKLNRTLYISDNLPILRGIDTESVDLIATDPPFNKGVKDFEGMVTAGFDKAGKKVTYKDVWTWRKFEDTQDESKEDVRQEWMDNIRLDHPNLHAVIEGANAGGGG